MFRTEHEKKTGWWRDKFVTLMVIPERTRSVRKFVVPFFLLKFAVVISSLVIVFLVMIGIDYIHVLGRMAENKQLKGENFKLRQDLQLIRNKVDSMETTIERVRNYAKKLQLLTGQGETGDWKVPQDALDTDVDREPATKSSGQRSEGFSGKPWIIAESQIENRIEQLQLASYATESSLTKLQISLLAKSALLAATPSLLPIVGWLSSPFGYRQNPYDGTFRLHAGVDLAADPGTPVRAPASGVVIYSGYREGYGKCIVINHGYGINTLFAHLSKLFVNTQEQVRRGDIISEVGSTGHSTGPHLHYEVRKNGVPVNPVAFYSRTRF